MILVLRVYDKLRSLLLPTKPQEKTFDEQLSVVRQHFDPKHLVGERFQFYKRSQRPTET